MLKITDGVNEKTVTKGMFDSLYKHMGYRVANEPKKPVIVKEEKPVILEEEKPIEIKEKKSNVIRKK